MQQAGIARNKDANRFNPQGNANRAKDSAVLGQFVEIVIDLTTAKWLVKERLWPLFIIREVGPPAGRREIGRK